MACGRAPQQLLAPGLASSFSAATMYQLYLLERLLVETLSS
jgi:hypothetical protein